MQHLTFSNIKDIDSGSVEIAVDKAVRQAIIDCQDRPNLKTARKVTLEISVMPRAHGQNMEYGDVSFNVKTTLPSRGITVPMKVTNEGLGFQPDASDNPDQSTLPFNEEE